MDIEWAKDGLTGELFIVQARPETIHSSKATTTMDVYHMTSERECSSRRKSVGEKIGAGPVRVVRHVEELQEFQAW